MKQYTYQILQFWYVALYLAVKEENEISTHSKILLYIDDTISSNMKEYVSPIPTVSWPTDFI